VQPKGEAMSAEHLISTWKDIRDGLIAEAAQIPADQFQFKATSETRSVAGILQHVVESQKLLVGESCRQDPNILRQSFAQHIKEYGAGVSSVNDKDGLLELLRSSWEAGEQAIRSHAANIDEPMQSFDGSETTKLRFLQFASSHEMYHRGQLTVYARLLNLEPVLTQRLKKIFADQS
jgi:uncharacterized damage-inducible protein DinB